MWVVLLGLLAVAVGWFGLGVHATTTHELKGDYAGCARKRADLESKHAQMHYTLFRFGGATLSDEDQSYLDSIVYEHAEAHDSWRDTCGAGGGGGGGQFENTNFCEALFE